jgi:hypothetical protein
MRGKAPCFLHMFQHKNGTRSVPGGIPTRERGNDQLQTAERDGAAVSPPSRAGSLPQGNEVHLQETGQLSGRHRRQASSHKGLVYTCKRLVGCQAAFAGKPAPTRVWCTSARDWSAVRPPSQASQLPQGFGVHRLETGRLSGRHREQAHSHNGSAYAFRFSPLIRPSVSSPAALDLAFDFDLPAPSGG